MEAPQIVGADRTSTLRTPRLCEMITSTNLSQRRRARKQSGLWKRYRDNGKLYDEGKFADGKKTGVWKFYDAAGKLSRTDRSEILRQSAPSPTTGPHHDAVRS